MIKEHKEFVEKVLKGLDKCFKFCNGNDRACRGCPYDEKGENCFNTLIANSYYLVQTILIRAAEEEKKENDRKNQQ